jgi:[CysO sulfur-carrier protein]-S-L-cysteine hydrolase
MITLSHLQSETIFNHAKKAAPAECCGLIGGSSESRAVTIYPVENVAVNPITSYEAAPEDLFAAQRMMRQRGEELLAIYHSHPRSADPLPSQTDVRLAFYPEAVYFIIGLASEQPVMRAFRIAEQNHRWQQVEYAISGE